MRFPLRDFVRYVYNNNSNKDNSRKMEIEKAANSPEINFITYSRDTQRKHPSRCLAKFIVKN